ncbi:MAG TPA: 3-hydroxyacyl-ACP dehydratase FabZ [Firmicutes bacterium]|jgi:3-hydroxyacyl-[acyl-carrier-protein] dehydratase|nr:3-hydroxyacyl-ACP dehydratase FabZ [Bacillota bacterium]
MLESKDIMAIIPHRAPFLLVDRIMELQPGQRAVGSKAVSGNEPYFAGHFPGQPVMPGVLIIEALAQVGAVAILAIPENRGRLALFAGIDKARFRRPVYPGDVLRLEVEIGQTRGAIGKGEAKAFVGQELVASAVLTYALVAGQA